MTRVAVTPGDECPAVTAGAAGAGTPGLRGSRRGAGSRAAPGPAPDEVPAAAVPRPREAECLTAAAAGAIPAAGDPVPTSDCEPAAGPLKEMLGRYRELIAEIGWLLEVELLTPAEAARRRHQTEALYRAGLADLLEWEAASGC